MPSKFCDKVYGIIKKIPPGRITTYKEVARCLNTRAYRAVGAALKANPHAPEVPCHRVVKSDGSIGGYSAKGGVKKKIMILEDEGVHVCGGRIDSFKRRFFRLGK
ncbi:MAG: MGMT family protein [Elusimicrobia bacterium]|nr:MGMT family protein [Elusimicrobiota bacterium]